MRILYLFWFLFFVAQITEALTFLHYSGHIIHRNVCPSSILVTKKGTWKLAGLEFTGKFLMIERKQKKSKKTIELSASSYAAILLFFLLCYNSRSGEAREFIFSFRLLPFMLLLFLHPLTMFLFSFFNTHSTICCEVNQFAIFIWIVCFFFFFCFLSFSFTHSLVVIEFPERVHETDPVEPVPCQPWSSRASKMTQPNLDYMGMYINAI